MGIDRANLGSRIEGNRQWHTLIILTRVTSNDSTPLTIDLHEAKRELRARALALGFGELGVTDIEIPQDEQYLLRWLEAGYHGDMDYMQRHGTLRSRPQELAPGTVRVVSVRMDYWPGESAAAEETLGDGMLGYVSRYALGRDYHKLMRKALAKLAEEMSALIGPFGYRVCVDSAPVLEKALSTQTR